MKLSQKIKGSFKLLIILSISVILISSSIASSDNRGRLFKSPDQHYVSDEIIIKFRESTSDATVMNALEQIGGNKIKELGKEHIVHIKIRAGQNIIDTIAEFEKNPNVEYAQPNYIYRLLDTSPNDPHYSDLWGLKNIGQAISDAPYPTSNPGTAGMDMDMELAWDYITDCSTIIVAVIDSGINYNHIDLVNNMWDGATNHGYDYVDDDDNPMDLNGHGTHLAGTIGAIGNNGVGTTGVCWNVSIMAVRVFNAAGSGTTADVISGIYYAVDNNAKILNLSFAGSEYDQALYNALQYARNHGVIAVAAAGNYSNDNDGGVHIYPCDFDLDNIVGVAALDQSYELADFSNYGKYSVDVGAPGTNIWSEWCGTETIITDLLTSGWTEGGITGWAYAVRDLGYGNVNLLVDPPDWGPPDGGYYSNNADDRIWKTFNLDGFDSAVLNYFVMFDVELGYDGFFTFCDDGIGDPIENGYQLAGWTGSTGGYFVYESYEIPYITSTCTIGFNLWSDIIVPDYGVAISDFSITAMTTNNTNYNILNGTSMAAPHVSGLAALIWVFNSDYSYKEVIESITNGGESIPSLNNNTTSGRAVNAWGSLKYIKPPTGLTISKY